MSDELPPVQLQEEPLRLNACSFMAPRTFKTDPISAIQNVLNRVRMRYVYEGGLGSISDMDVIAITTEEAVEHVYCYIRSVYGMMAGKDAGMPENFKASSPVWIHGIRLYFDPKAERDTMAFYSLAGPQFKPVAILENLAVG